MSIETKKLHSWLSTKGKERRKSASEAAKILLASYREHKEWLQIIPIELHRLASTLNTRIEEFDKSSGEALLIPVRGGFSIYVKSQPNYSRLRTSIAHELAHILFYNVDGEEPTRIKTPDEKEERFCFDVARRILAPDWHLKAIGVEDSHNLNFIFEAMTETLALSREVAAQLILQDYCLVKGVGGRWIKKGESYILQRGKAYASPSLEKSERKELHEQCRKFIESGAKPDSNFQIVDKKERTGDAFFVVLGKFV